MRCSVDNCHYWRQGMVCGADEISITDEDHGALVRSKVATPLGQTTPGVCAQTAANTCCASFLARGTFEAFEDRITVTHEQKPAPVPGDRGGIGASVVRKEAWDKVTGQAKYNADTKSPEILYAKCLLSPHAHALIKSIDASACDAIPSVTVLTGANIGFLCGDSIYDKPPLAKDKVRHYGEAVALAVAHTPLDAANACRAIKPEYEPLPCILGVEDAARPEAPLVHPDLHLYDITDPETRPQPGSNIANAVKIRKGDPELAWQECDTIVEASYSLPKSNHAFMETRNARACVHATGMIEVWTSTQAPFGVRKQLARYFGKSENQVAVHTPLVGGGFGGKVTSQLETLVCLASQAVGGRMVQLVSPREQDLVMSPCEIGLATRIKIGALKDGTIKAMDMTFWIDTGAYSDTGTRIARAIAADCTGPYKVDNVLCDCFCVYTNSPYATSFRSFGHVECNFPVERTMDKLARALGMDPLDLRQKNAVRPGDTSPTQTPLTESNLGNIDACISKIRDLIQWDERPRGPQEPQSDGKTRSYGISCFWKAPDPPIDASSGAALTFNSDGSLNLSVGATEIGPGMKTTLAQIAAEALQMDVADVHVTMGVDTQVSPLHWKTVASMTTFMAGNAVLDAARSLSEQIKSVGAIALRCQPEDLEVAAKRVYLRESPDNGIDFKDFVLGLKHSDGSAVGGQIMAQGSYIARHLTAMNPDTGKGVTTPTRTVGVQAVEVEFDPKDCSYTVLRAVTVIDAGRVLNPLSAKGVVMGGMSMGLSLATREAYVFSPEGEVQNTSLRTYKMLRFGGHPCYTVEFVETPQSDGPFGARAIGEHGVIGMPAALAGALSEAAGVDLDSRPISPETIWNARRAKDS